MGPQETKINFIVLLSDPLMSFGVMLHISLASSGTYGPDESYASESDCIRCPAGLYCEEPASDSPTAQCYAGYYCTGGALSPTPRNHMVCSRQLCRTQYREKKQKQCWSNCGAVRSPPPVSLVSTSKQNAHMAFRDLQWGGGQGSQV